LVISLTFFSFIEDNPGLTASPESRLFHQSEAIPPGTVWRRYWAGHQLNSLPCSGVYGATG